MIAAINGQYKILATSPGVECALWRIVDGRNDMLVGMISAEKLRAYHVQRHAVEEEGDSGIFKDDTRAADDRAVLLKVRDMVTAAVDAAQFNQRLDRMKALATGQIAKKPERAIEVLAQKVGCTEDEGQGILAALIQGGDLSAWGFLNAVTAQANTAKSYDRAVELEAAGGQLLAMDTREWAKVLEAA